MHFSYIVSVHPAEIGYRLTLGVTCDGLVSHQGGVNVSRACVPSWLREGLIYMYYL